MPELNSTIPPKPRGRYRRRPPTDGEPCGTWKGEPIYHLKGDKYFVRRYFDSQGRTPRCYLFQRACSVCEDVVYVESANVSKHPDQRHTCNKLECKKTFNAGPNNPNFTGGRKLKRTPHGNYVLIYRPDHPFARKNYIPEHRLVVEAEIGRYLTPEEMPHHIDLNPANNDPLNLALCADNQEHLRIHATISRCVGALLRQGTLRFNRDLKCYEVAA